MPESLTILLVVFMTGSEIQSDRVIMMKMLREQKSFWFLVANDRLWPFFAFEAWHLKVCYREKQSFKIEGPRATRDPNRPINAY